MRENSSQDIYEKNKYVAEVKRWLDGDTVELSVDLGMSVSVDSKFRLARIDAPEIKKYAGVTNEEKQRGLELKELLNNKIPKGSEVVVNVIKKGKYGRYLVEVWSKDDEGILYNVNDWLLNEGLAEGASY
tara:strand:- start:274 stop:663 length:390 start_codon:yes stop_codon:yes gene_type:complete